MESMTSLKVAAYLQGGRTHGDSVQNVEFSLSQWLEMTMKLELYTRGEVEQASQDAGNHTDPTAAVTVAETKLMGNMVFKVLHVKDDRPLNTGDAIARVSFHQVKTQTGRMYKRWILATIVMSAATAVSSTGELVVIEQQQAELNWMVLAGCASIYCMFVWHVCNCLSGLAILRRREEVAPPPCPQVFYVTHIPHQRPALHQDRNCHTISLSRIARPYELCRVCCADLVKEEDV